MTHLTLEQIQALEKRKRSNLMNYLSGFKSANLVGTISETDQHNLAVFNSVVHIGANPPYLGFILRPHTVPRHTYENIKATGYYTINHITQSIYTKAHQTSAKYDESVSEFEAVGLTAVFRGNFKAPYVQESPIQLGLQFEEAHQIKCNDTILVIGKVLEVWLPDESVAEDGYINLSEHGVMTISGLDAYHTTKKIARLAYARPK